MPKIIGRRPSVPEYYQEFINQKVNLLDEPKQCCPFHHENTPSFSYNPETGRWSCFGACHAHGDVIEMHRRVYHLDSYEEARKSLDTIYEVEAVRNLNDTIDIKTRYINEDKIADEVLYQKAILLAGNNKKRWIQLDYVMSIVPLERWRLQELVNMWGGSNELC